MRSKKIIPNRISRTSIYSNELLDLNVDKILLSTGKIIDKYHVLDYKIDSVVVLMFNKLNEICFIKSPRYVTQSLELELPSGGLLKGESIKRAAKREILEETGYKITRLKHLLSFHPSNAISNQKCHIILGHYNENAKIEDFDRNEVHEVLWLSNENILKLLKNKKIMDGHTLIPILYYFTFLNY